MRVSCELPGVKQPQLQVWPGLEGATLTLLSAFSLVRAWELCITPQSLLIFQDSW